MRGKLNQEWANWRKFYKFQPTDAIMKYFGVKIGFYFAWLGFYTAMLVIPSIMGILSFFYGLVRMYSVHGHSNRRHLRWIPGKSHHVPSLLRPLSLHKSKGFGV